MTRACAFSEVTDSFYAGTSFTFYQLRCYSLVLMRTVDLIHRKRDREELSPEEIAYLVDGYTDGTIPDYQMAAFLMAVFFSGMTDREVSSLTERMMGTGGTRRPFIYPGYKSRQTFYRWRRG